MTLLRYLLETDHRAKTSVDEEVWWDRWTSLRGRYDSPFDTAAACAFEQERLAWVLASGYQGAIEALFPTPESVRRSLCVTEAGGNSPAAIESRYDPDAETLNGTKTIVTLGTTAERFLVLAARGEDRGSWKDLVILDVDAQTDGVDIVRSAPFSLVPEIEHASVTFNDVAVSESDVVRKRAWETAIKPFRLVEDIFVLGATAAWFVRLSRRTGQVELTHRLTAILEAGSRLSLENPMSHAAAIAYAGLLDFFTETIERFDWSDVEPDVRERWARDRGLLEVASRVREIRTELADRTYDLSNATELERWDWKRGEMFEGYVAWTDDGWLYWEEWETAPRGGAAQHEQRVADFLTDGAPSWVPEDVVANVRETITEARAGRAPD